MARWGHSDLELSSFGGGEETKVRMAGDTETENRDPSGTVSSEGLTQALLWSVWWLQRVTLLVTGAKS